MKRVTFLLLVFALLLSILPVQAEAAKQSEYWSLSELLEMGAVPPSYNSAMQRYEISTPEQLLFLSGEWKQVDTNADGAPDAPRDGQYVLMNDIDMQPLMKRLGYMPPLACNKEENSDRSDGWFRGVFDGQYFAIVNLVLYKPSQSAGLFCYAGSAVDSAQIKNLALLHVSLTGKKNVGAIAGVSYATIENCLVTGKISSARKEKDGDTVGGIVGSLKTGGGRAVGRVENCFAYVSVQGGSCVGGIVGHQDGGGYVNNCLAAGDIKSSGMPAHAGGICGAFHMGNALTGCVSLQTSIACASLATDAGKIAGSLPEENGAHILKNAAWEGTQLIGNPANSYPEQPIYSDLTDEAVFTKRTYKNDLQWDFHSIWTWVGEETNGYPMLSGYAKRGNAPDMIDKLQADIQLQHAVLLGDCRQKRTVTQGAYTRISVRALAPEKTQVKDVRLYYGKRSEADVLIDYVQMEWEEGAYACEFPEEAPGEYMYYIQAQAGKELLYYPYYKEAPAVLVVQEAGIHALPYEISLTPGSNFDEMGFCWLTEETGVDTQIRYREQQDTHWTLAKGESVLRSFGYEAVQSHRITLSALKPDIVYEYQVGGEVGGVGYWSDVYTFKAMPNNDEFTFAWVSDVQARTPLGNESFFESLQYMQSHLGLPDFLLNTGDLVDNGFQSEEWAALFAALHPYYETLPMINIPGNHDQKGDPNYEQFGARFLMPNGFEGLEETTGWFEIADACIVVINTFVMPAENQAACIQAQLAWAERVFESAGKKWRILASHAGPYTINNDPAPYRPLLSDACDRMRVDLYLSGHDHMYMRGSLLAGQKVAPGEGTTYITSGAVGEDFGSYKKENDPYVEVHADGDFQVLKMVTVMQDRIAVKVYQRADEGDQINWSHWDVVDDFEIAKCLSAPSPTPAVQTLDSTPVFQQEVEEQTPPRKSGALWIIVITGAVIAISLYIIAGPKDKKQ